MLSFADDGIEDSIADEGMLNFTLKSNGHQQLEWYWLFGESQPNNSRVRWRFSTSPVILLGILYCNAHQIAQYQVSQTCHEHIPKVITLPSRPRHPRLHSNIFDATWGHFFLCGVMTFSYYVMFIHNMFIFKKKAYRAFCVKKTLRICPDNILSSADKQRPCWQLSSWR